MNFKPSKIKVIISIIAVVAWYIFLYIWVGGMTCECIYPSNCPDVFSFSLYSNPINCSCGCVSQTTFFDILKESLIVLFPGVLIYVIWSLFQKKVLNGKLR